MASAIRAHVMTDLLGYRRLIHDRTEADLDRLMRTYERIIRARLPTKASEVDHVADGFHLVFAAPHTAVTTSLEVADAFAAHNLKHPDLTIPAKFGIAAGESRLRGGRYLGPAPVIAAVLAGRAQPGQILLADSARGLLRPAESAAMRDLGLWKAPGLPSLHVYEARPPDSSGPAPLVDNERFLATLLFTDIVRSTAAAAEAGDRNWRRVVEQHHAIVRDELQRHGGLEADTAGDGFYATFETPSHAIDCARALRDRLRTIGVEIRAGVHVGECQVVAGKIGGIAVALGSRVTSQGGAGDLLVSQTVKDLLLGTKFVFAERGRVSLKGVPGEWTLYTVED